MVDPTQPQWSPIDLEKSSFLEKNLAAFQKRYPTQYEELVQSRARVESLQVCALGDDQVACMDSTSGQVIYSPKNLHSEIKKNYAQALAYDKRGTRLFLIAGAGFNYLASHLEADIRGDLARGLVVLEDRLELIYAQFALFDCVSLITSGQVYWALGESLLDVAEAERLGLVAGSQIAMIAERDLVPEERERYRKRWVGFQGHVIETSKRLEQNQAAFNARIAQPPALDGGKLWGFVNPRAYAHTPLGKAFAEGFTHHGWESHLLETEEGFSTRNKIGESMVVHAPDILLFCNAPSGEFVNDQVQRPRVTLMMDDPNHFNYQAYHDRLGPMDTVLYMERTWEAFFAQMPGTPAYFMPVYPSITRIGKRVPELHTPVVFVGSHTPVSVLLGGCPTRHREAIEALVDRKLKHPTDKLQTLLDAVSLTEESVEFFARLAVEFTKTLPRSFNNDQHRMGYYLYSLANSVKRERYISTLLDLGITIYGPESWLGFLGEKHASCFRGWLDPNALPDVYASADVCVNLHSLQCPTCLNVRDFDVLHAGGCLVGDWVADSDSGLIQDEHDLLVARSPDELRTHVARLLNDDALREKIRQQGHATCHTKHQPHHRVWEFLPKIKANWNAYCG